jgi:hypothetical protein
VNLRTRLVALALLFACGWQARAQAPPFIEGVEVAGDTVIFKGQINASSVAQFLRALQDPAVIGRPGRRCMARQHGARDVLKVEDFYYLSLDDMERFGIRDITLRDKTAVAHADGLVRVQVDWAALQAIRPVVKLDR